MLRRGFGLLLILSTAAACGVTQTSGGAASVGASGTPSSTATAAPVTFENSHIYAGMTGSGHNLAPPPAGSTPSITADQAEAIAVKDPLGFLGSGPPVQAVLVEMTQGQQSSSTPTAVASDTSPSATPLDSRYDTSPCLCWVVDMTPPHSLLDDVHNKFPVQYVVVVVDAATGAVRVDQEG